MQIKECFIDVETTGLDIKRCAIVQCSGIICVDKEEKERFDFYITPHTDALINDAAMAVHGIKKDDDRMIRPREAYHRLLSIFTTYVDKFNRADKMFFAGYNVANFDWPFMYEFWTRQGDKYFGSLFMWPPLDVAVLAAEYLKKTRHLMPNFKLATVASSLGVMPEGDLHDAMTDIKLTMDIYRKIGG